MAQTNTHRYRLIGSLENDLTLITEYGDIGSLTGTRLEFYSLRISDVIERPDLDFWSALGEGKIFTFDWKVAPTEAEFVKESISWLSPHNAADEWVRDDSLFPYLFADPTEQEARATLRQLGYFTGNLWQVRDVLTKVDCTEEEAQVVLYRALTSEVVYDAIWDTIKYYGEEFGKVKEEGDDE